MTQQAVPIQLIATSQGMIAIPQSYQIEAPAAAATKMVIASEGNATGSEQPPVIFYTVPQGGGTPQFVTFSSPSSSTYVSSSPGVVTGSIVTPRNVVNKQKRKLGLQDGARNIEPLVKIEKTSSAPSAAMSSDNKPVVCDSRTLESIIRAATAGGGSTMLLDSSGNQVSLASLLNFLPKSSLSAAAQSDGGMSGESNATISSPAPSVISNQRISPVVGFQSNLAAQIQDGYDKSFFNLFSQLSSGFNRRSQVILIFTVNISFRCYLN